MAGTGDSPIRVRRMNASTLPSGPNPADSSPGRQATSEESAGARSPRGSTTTVCRPEPAGEPLELDRQLLRGLGGRAGLGVRAP